MRGARSLGATLAMSVSLFAASHASAQIARDLASGAATPPAMTNDHTAPLATGHWGPPRWFLQGTLDLGFLFLRPRLDVGWGTPHETFVAFEVAPLVSGSGLGAYAGAHAKLRYVELRAGARFAHAFTRSFLTPMAEFDHIQVRDRTGPPASYISLEAQIDLRLPLADIVDFVSEGVVTFTLMPSDRYVFEDALRTVIAPPLVWSANAGVEVRFGDEGVFYFTPTVEVINVVERGQLMVRAGVRAGARLWPELELRVIAVPTIVSPDRLGAMAADTFLVGFRWRWTTR